MYESGTINSRGRPRGLTRTLQVTGRCCSLGVLQPADGFAGTTASAATCRNTSVRIKKEGAASDSFIFVVACPPQPVRQSLGETRWQTGTHLSRMLCQRASGQSQPSTARSHAHLTTRYNTQKLLQPSNQAAIVESPCRRDILLLQK